MKGWTKTTSSLIPIGKAVPGLPGVDVMSLAEFQKHVNSLDTRKGHSDDHARKDRRVRRLRTEHYEEKDFTPRDLTVTSHLVRVGAQVSQRAFPSDQRPPRAARALSALALSFCKSSKLDGEP